MPARNIADSYSSLHSPSKAFLQEDEDSSLFIQNLPLSICFFLSPVEETLVLFGKMFRLFLRSFLQKINMCLAFSLLLFVQSV